MAGLLLELTETEASEIIRKQAIVSKQNACGALDIRGGSVILHYDLDGNLRVVERHDYLLRDPK